MTAYVISEVRPLDTELLERYRTVAAQSISEYGGRYLARGGPVDAAEGDIEPGYTLIVVEFPSMARLREWYESDEYAVALRLRHDGALERRLLFVDGV